MSSSSLAEPVKIAAIFAKTGKAAKTNLLSLQGVRFAVEEINEQSGLLGRKIELVEFDNHSTPLGSKLAAKKSIDSGVVSVIGASWSSHSLAMAPVLQEAKITMISTGSTNVKVTRVGNFIFRACFIDPFQGTVMAYFAVQDLKAKRAAVLTNVNSKYSIGLAEFFIKRFKKLGGQVLWEGKYLENAADFKPLVKEIKILQPDVVFLPGHVSDSGLIIKQARKMGVSVLFLGGDGWGEQMYQYGGETIERNYYSTHWHGDVSIEKSRRFVKRYEKKYGAIRNDGIPLCYDAVMLLADAVKRANSSDPNRIRDALSTTTNFQGVTGSITLDQYGDPIKDAVILKFGKESPIYVKTIKP